MLVAILGVGACGAGSGSARSPVKIVINDAHPAYRGVHLGSSMSTVIRLLGKPPPDKSPYTTPLGEDPDVLGLPTIVAAPPGPRLRSANEIRDLRYHHVVFSVTTTRVGVYYFAVSAPGSETSRRVGVGDSLARARKAYGGVLHCGIANNGAGIDYPHYPYCYGRLRTHLYVYFGQDPIRSIAFASVFAG